MNSEKAFVTIILPVYNAAQHLNEAIDCILHQSYSFFELLLINDGSTDGSEEIIQSYTDSRIRYIKNPKNIGLIDTLNLGFSLAEGKYIARMDADDICSLNRLEKQVEFLNENHSVGLVGSDYESFGTINKSIHYPSSYEELKFSALFYNPFCHPSMMIRKEIIVKNNAERNIVFCSSCDLFSEQSFSVEALKPIPASIINTEK